MSCSSPDITGQSIDADLINSYVEARLASANLVNRPKFDSSLDRGDWSGSTTVVDSQTAGLTTGLNGTFQYVLRSTARDSYESNNYFPVTPGEVIYFGAWVNTELTTQSAGPGLHLEDNAGGNDNWPTQLLAAGNDWTFVTRAYTVGANHRRARPFFQISSFSNYGEAFAVGFIISRSEIRATQGATWGSDITGQPSDTALLNANQTWAEVSGAGIPEDNATVGADWSSNVSGVPANLSALVGTEGIQNTQIQINADGSLTNAGTGQVTISGLGYTGALDATRGATWGTDITGQPTDSALLNINQTWAEVSGVGRPADNATVGATWGTDVNSRPTELVDGRVLSALESSGNLSPGISVNQGNDVYRGAAFGVDIQSARDGDAVTFPVAWDTIPNIQFLPSGLSYSSSLTGDQVQDYKALSISTTGFTVSAKVKELVGSTVSVTRTYATYGSAGTGAEPDFLINKSTTTQAWDDTYEFQFDVTVANLWDTEFSQYFAGTVSVGIYTNDGAGWVKRATVNFSGSTSSATTSYLNQLRSVVVDGLGNHAGEEFGINIESDTFGGSTINFDQVTFDTATAPSEASATPTGAPDVNYAVLGS